MTKRESLTIFSSPDQIKKVEQFIVHLKQRMQLSDDVYGNLMITVTEAVNNAIEHGNKNNPKKKVTITAHLTPKKLKITVSDEGTGFRREKISNPLKPENLLKNSGRGVYIMESLADEISYSNKGSRVILTFYLK